MKACVLESVGKLVLKDVPAPKPKAGEVLLNVKACGICSSDIDRVFKTGTYHFPTIPGHEIAGEIVQVGESVDKTLLHQRAVVFPLLPCFKCPSCAVGEYAKCYHYNYFGSRCDGGFAEYLSVPVWNLKTFPNGVPFSVAAMCEPASVALHAVNIARIQPGNTVLIVGDGTIGQLAAIWAKISGAGRVILVGHSKEKLKCTQSLSLGETINALEVDSVKAIYDVTAGNNVDVSLEFAGNSQSVSTAILGVKKGGKVILTGNPSREVKLERNVYWKILRDELNISGTWNSKYNLFENDWDTTLKYMAEGKLNPEPLITSRFPIEEYSSAFEILLKKQGAIKVILEP